MNYLNLKKWTKGKAILRKSFSIMSDLENSGIKIFRAQLHANIYQTLTSKIKWNISVEYNQQNM